MGGDRVTAGFVAQGGYRLGGDDAIAVWTADATFDVNKYNYFKILSEEGEFLEAESKNTWQQLDAGYAIVNGNKWSVEVETLGEWWSTDIQNEHMMSRMQQRYCSLRLEYNGKVMKGRALNERCFGTLN